MASYLKFIRDNPQLLAFGFSLTLFSSFGQTFLLSLYIPELADLLSISIGRMGSVWML
ncbi:MAG: hypothetical protein U5L96_10655 [Owenweeksia sp.]|nr:hypothetical protein [Owenweeksia sp.]